MNVIEYLQQIHLIEDSYERLKKEESTIFHLRDSFGEGNTNIYILHKDQTKFLEDALVIQILNDEMRHGNYVLTNENEDQILKLNIDELNERYSESFTESKELTLRGQLEKYSKNRIKEIFKNYDWELKVTFEDLFNQDWINEKTIKAYTAKTEWNDEDYFFDTDNYFIRFNWGTGA